MTSKKESSVVSPDAMDYSKQTSLKEDSDLDANNNFCIRFRTFSRGIIT